jgi:hypothetical protein
MSLAMLAANLARVVREILTRYDTPGILVVIILALDKCRALPPNDGQETRPVTPLSVSRLSNDPSTSGVPFSRPRAQGWLDEARRRTMT